MGSIGETCEPKRENTSFCSISDSSMESDLRAGEHKTHHVSQHLMSARLVCAHLRAGRSFLGEEGVVHGHATERDEKASDLQAPENFLCLIKSGDA